MKILILLLIPLLSWPQEFNDEQRVVCAVRKEIAQIDAYIDSIKDHKHCRGAFIPVAKWSCQLSESSNCSNDMEEFICQAHYQCQYSNIKQNFVTLLRKLRRERRKLNRAPISIPNCSTYPTHLTSCQKFRCQFKHPISGTLLMRKISGINTEKCHTSEDLPNGGQIKCSFSSQQQKEIAEFIQANPEANLANTEITLNFSSNTYNVTAEENKNPIQLAIDNGTCQISK